MGLGRDALVPRQVHVISEIAARRLALSRCIIQGCLQLRKLVLNVCRDFRWMGVDHCVDYASIDNDRLEMSYG